MLKIEVFAKTIMRRYDASANSRVEKRKTANHCGGGGRRNEDGLARRPGDSEHLSFRGTRDGPTSELFSCFQTHHGDVIDSVQCRHLDDNEIADRTIRQGV